MKNIRYEETSNELYILDQTLLPNKEEELLLDSKDKMFDAIKFLKVRGAPAIGICAAYSLAALSVNKTKNKDVCASSEITQLQDFFISGLKEDAAYLNSARPTAVNLSYALDRMLNKALQLAHGSKDNPDTLSFISRGLVKEAKAIHDDEIDMCQKISEHGLSLLKDGFGILTHCNAGPLATAGYGTALGPILLGHETGMKFHVYADETRPLLQGARLTTYELYKAGVDVTLICDNMAASVMKKGLIDAVLVGSDRIAANGDVANKIGTSQVAIMAKHFGIPFYVLAPSSTVDLKCPTGEDIIIEEREPEEIKTMFFEKPVALEGVDCFNPSFDVTDHELVSAIITEKGIIYPPFEKNIADSYS